MSNPFTKSFLKAEEKNKRKISYADDIEYFPPPKSIPDNTSNPSGSEEDFENFTSYKPDKLMQKIMKNERDLTFYLAKNKEYSKKASSHMEKAMKLTEKLKLLSKALEVVLASTKNEEPTSRKRERSLSNDEEFNQKERTDSKSMRNYYSDNGRNSKQGSYSKDDSHDRRSYSENNRDSSYQSSKRRNNSSDYDSYSKDYSASDRYRNSEQRKDDESTRGRQSRENSVSRDYSNSSERNIPTSGDALPGRLKVVGRTSPAENNLPSKAIFSSSILSTTADESPKYSTLTKESLGRNDPRSPSEAPSEEIVLEGDIVSEDDGSNLIPFQEQLASYVENQLESPPPATIPFDPTVKEWEIKSSGSRQTLNNLKSVKLTNFGRNARDVLVQEDSGTFPDLAFASPNDGTIQVYDLKARSTIHTIPASELKNSRSETMEWITDDVLVVASNYEKLIELTLEDKGGSSSYELHQLALIHNCEIQTLGKNKVFTNKILRVTQYPHTKNITTIGKMPVTDNIKWLTGGNDKLITLWTHTGGSGQALRTQRVHFEHTNAVTSIYYQDFTDILFSGGKDKRLIGYNLERDRVVTGNGKNDHQIREIIPIPGQKHLLLVSFIDKNCSLKLYDTRLQIYVSQWQLPDPPAEAKAPSVYQKPSIHKNGNLVAIGDCMSDIHLWDLRYANYEKTPSQVISTHKNRVMGTRFYDRHNHSLLSWCTNNDFYMTSYT
ncbi:hypothetical protein HDV06_003322 [Boothiomyces sp. JEL0866]|nr:hypothetical protein HDV06_003322 [Boothiomyces sp. JEL0866]